MTETSRISISFAVPYYSNRDYLCEAIDSVRRQTVEAWELVVVDDAGPEPAEQLVDAYRDPRIRYVRNERSRGLPGNWNECVGLTSAPLLTLLHADDRLRPTYAASILGAAERHPAAAAFYTNVKIIDAEGRPNQTYVDTLKKLITRASRAGEISGDAGLARLLAANFIYCPTLAFRRDSVGSVPFDESLRFVCDWDLTVRLMMDGESLVGLEQPLLEYRRHAAQTTARLTEDSTRFVEELDFLVRMSNRAAERGFPRASRAARRRLSTRIHVALSATFDLARGRVGPARRKAALLGRDIRRTAVREPGV